MSLASEILSGGATVLTEINGETVAFRSAPLDVVISYLPEDGEPGSRPDLNLRASSIVHVQQSALSEMPETGESFMDGHGNYHRIQIVKLVGIAWLCTCEVTKAP